MSEIYYKEKPRDAFIKDVVRVVATQITPSTEVYLVLSYETLRGKNYPLASTIRMLSGHSDKNKAIESAVRA